jgi:hypothetical protein
MAFGRLRERAGALPASDCLVCRSIGASVFSPVVLCCPHGVIEIQHRRKISSILIRDTVAPIAIRTTPGSCSLTEITEARSCYEHSPGPSKTVRTAVGHSIFSAGSFGRASKPAAGARESPDCRACQIRRTARHSDPAGMEKPPGRLDRAACRFVLSHAGGNSSA